MTGQQPPDCSPGAPDAEYTRLAPHYDRRWRRYVRASVAETIACLDPAPGERLLDLGCGTGVLLEAVAERFPGTRHFGLDRSEPMLGQARQRCGPATGLVAASAECLPFADERFDWVISSSVFHYLRQPAVTLAEVHRILRPDGHLVITDWCRDFLAMRLLDGWLSRTNQGHFRTPGLEPLCRDLNRSGFERIRGHRFRIGWFWGLMTVQARRPSRDAGVAT